jgi:hypothetical protein
MPDYLLTPTEAFSSLSAMSLAKINDLPDNQATQELNFSKAQTI